MLTNLDVVPQQNDSMWADIASSWQAPAKSPECLHFCGFDYLTQEMQSQEMQSDSAVEITPSDIVKHRRMIRAGLGTEIVQATRRERIEFQFQAPVHLLAVFEHGARSAGESSIEGVSPSALKDFEHKLILVPAGHKYNDWQEPRKLTRAIYFYFNPLLPPMSMALGAYKISFTPRLFFEDATLYGTALKLAALIESWSADNGLYFDALSLVLAHEIVRFAQERPQADLPVHGGLPPWQQRLIIDYLEEHLDEQVTLATLADLVRLSPHYFCRAFKQSMGMPPHRYHTRRRIERAKSLLANSSISVTEIGLSVGFNETSSFSAAFRQATGSTPTAYRQNFA